MAGTYFWGTKEDNRAMILAIFKLNCYGLAPDLHYPTPIPQIHTTFSEEIMDQLDKKSRIYVAGPFSKKPMDMRCVNNAKPDKKYYIYETTGGPLLIFSSPKCLEKDTPGELVPGEFYYRSSYWDKDLNQPLKPSEELKEHYKIILKEIKRCLVRKKIGAYTCLIGRDAINLLSKNKAIILKHGKWWSSDGSFVKSNISELHKPTNVTTNAGNMPT